jgi:SAM-dependent methyltransferase
LSNSKVAVVSSLSPWVEHLLRRMGASYISTFDHDPPIVCSEVYWIDSKELLMLNNEPGTYDLLVSFSGIEHYGLGAYGDPINPNADMEAMQSMYNSLKPGGVLMLAVPTANLSHIDGVHHRIYGPDKLEELLNGFEFMGRVWDGHVLGGWHDVNVEPVLFPPSGDAPVVGRVDWRHQNVLVLRKPILQLVKQGWQVLLVGTIITNLNRLSQAWCG